MVSNEDNSIIRECLGGNPAAYELLVDKYETSIFNVALRLVEDYDDAKDITQEVFIKAYEKLDTFNPKYKFFSWIYKMTVNLSLNLINRRKRQMALTDNMISRENSPDVKVDGKSRDAVVQNAISELSLDHRVIVILRHFADLSYRDLSYVLEIPEITVKSRLFAARRRLGGILKKMGIVEYE